MEQLAVCCRDLPRRNGVKSPFAKIIALDWYDGPRAGLLSCGQCAREYRFEPLDEVYNGHQGRDWRIFSLAFMPEGSMKRLADAFAPYETPWGIHPQVWVPLRDKFPSLAEEFAMDRLTSRLLCEASSPELAIASSDIAEEILAARKLKAGDLDSVKDWFAYLGVARTHAEV
jgi:hypothetical protein